MSQLTVGEMIGHVRKGRSTLFERSIPDGGEECFFMSGQNWDRAPERLEWLNPATLETAPWFGSRSKLRIPVSTLAPPDVRFNGPSADMVDFYSTGCHAFFISDRLLRLIEDEDRDSLDHVPFEVRTADGTMPFHAVMPRRLVEAIDTRRTNVLIKDDDLGGRLVRRATFPDGIVFDNDLLEGASSFADPDAPGWYWSKELIARARGQGICGLVAMSVAAVPQRVFALL